MSHLQAEREKLIVAQRASGTLHTKELNHLRVQLKQVREESMKHEAHKNANDRACKSAEAKCFTLREEVKRLQQQLRRAGVTVASSSFADEDDGDNNNNNSNNKQPLLVFRTRKEQAKSIEVFYETVIPLAIVFTILIAIMMIGKLSAAASGGCIASRTLQGETQPVRSTEYERVKIL